MDREEWCAANPMLCDEDGEYLFEDKPWEDNYKFNPKEDVLVTPDISELPESTRKELAEHSAYLDSIIEKMKKEDAEKRKKKIVFPDVPF